MRVYGIMKGRAIGLYDTIVGGMRVYGTMGVWHHKGWWVRLYGTMGRRAMGVYNTMRGMAMRMYGTMRGRAMNVYGTTGAGP